MANDPISKAMHAARISMLFTRPELAAEAARLRFAEATGECRRMELKDSTLLYNREYAKSLTCIELASMIARLLHTSRILGIDRSPRSVALEFK